VAAHLVLALEEGVFPTTILALRRRNPARAFDELARRRAQSPATEIAASLRNLADHQYWRLPPKIPARLAEILCHSGDIKIPLGVPFEPDPQLTMIALEMLTGPFPFGFVPLGRLRGLGWQATDIDRRWGKGPEIRGQTADLLMAAVGRSVTLDALDGPALPLLRQRIWLVRHTLNQPHCCPCGDLDIGGFCGGWVWDDEAEQPQTPSDWLAQALILLKL
jgi:hypothetical protein